MKTWKSILTLVVAAGALTAGLRPGCSAPSVIANALRLRRAVL